MIVVLKNLGIGVMNDLVFEDIEERKFVIKRFILSDRIN